MWTSHSTFVYGALVIKNWYVAGTGMLAPGLESNCGHMRSRHASSTVLLRRQMTLLHMCGWKPLVCAVRIRDGRDAEKQHDRFEELSNRDKGLDDDQTA